MSCYAIDPHGVAGLSGEILDTVCDVEMSVNRFPDYEPQYVDIE